MVRMHNYYLDTDSLCYHIHTDDVYTDMKSMRTQLDTSNYQSDHSLYDTTNKKKLGNMKDETASRPIEEFVGLRAKLYAYRLGDRDDKRAKGVVKRVADKTLSIDDYRRVLFRDQHVVNRQMQIIVSTSHEVYTAEINKTALSGDDDKRVVQDDRVHTLAYGHYKLVGNSDF